MGGVTAWRIFIREEKSRRHIAQEALTFAHCLSVLQYHILEICKDCGINYNGIRMSI